MNRVTDPDVGPSIDAHLRREDAADQRDSALAACEAEIFEAMMARKTIAIRSRSEYTGQMRDTELFPHELEIIPHMILAALAGQVLDPLRFIREHVEEVVRNVAAAHAADRLRYLEESRNDY